jgi:hypothetical protein
MDLASQSLLAIHPKLNQHLLNNLAPRPADAAACSSGAYAPASINSGFIFPNTSKTVT